MDRDAALAELAPMPSRLEAWLSACPPERLRLRPAKDAFAPIEHLWHLADLEVEAYGLRLRRIRDEEAPQLSDFDGGAEAEARGYLGRDPEEALRHFRLARRENLRAFEALAPEQWRRGGEQAGVGPVTLAELPGRMAAHDLEHWRDLRLALL